MRTRRSPRNQEILFRALFRPTEESRPPVDRVAVLERMIADPRHARIRRQLERDLLRERYRRASSAALGRGAR